MRLFFEISYDGKNYNGWQSQPNATGIQEVVTDSLTKLLRTPIEIVGSGRTDTGVHCKQQYFHCDVPDGTDRSKLLHQMNSILPSDIAIKSILNVKPDAHARFDALERSYIYQITTCKDPFKQGYAWHFFKPLQLQTMNDAAALLIGNHDFQCFSKVKTDVKNYFCTITYARWSQTGESIEFNISANRFLRGMVRAIVGTLIDVGVGKTSVEEFRTILASRDRREAGQNVPPYGLYLTKVVYPQEVFLEGNESE